MTATTGNLVGYCGLYCGACGIRQGRVKQAVENLRRVIGAYGIDKIAAELVPWEPAFGKYAAFEEVMGGLLKLFDGCAGCVAGGGDPTCTMRQCCQEAGRPTCAECGEHGACAKVAKYPWAAPALLQVKEQGLTQWEESMRRKVEAGFCYLDQHGS